MPDEAEQHPAPAAIPQLTEARPRLLDYAPPPRNRPDPLVDGCMTVLGNGAMLVVGLFLPIFPLIAVADSPHPLHTTFFAIILLIEAVVGILLLRSDLTRMLGISMLLTVSVSTAVALFQWLQ